MTTFRHLARMLKLLLVVAVLGPAGCGNSDPGGNDDSGTTQQATQDTGDALGTAIEILHHEPDLRQCQEALQLINSHWLQKPEQRRRVVDVRLDERFLRQECKLTDEEINWLKQPSFNKLDGHYLSWCFQRRSLAEALRLSEIPGSHRAKVIFAWAMRQVMLENPGRQRLRPPQFTLMFGRGTPVERALLCVSMMLHAGIPACLVQVAPPHTSSDALLVAAMVKEGEERQVLLFEPRLGLAVNADARPATLDDLLKNPKLLEQFSTAGHKYLPQAIKPSEIELLVAFPLAALSPRMRFVERELSATLALPITVDARNLLETFRKVHPKVRVWNAAAGADGTGSTSPLRALHAFLPAEEGGRGSKHEYARLQVERTPWLAVKRNLEGMQIFGKLANDNNWGWGRLLFVSGMFMEKFIVRARDRLAHGRWEEELTAPLLRLRKVLKDFRQYSQFHRDLEQQRAAIEKWITQINEGILRLESNPQQAKMLLESAWNDPFFSQLINLGQKEDSPLRRDLQKRMVTMLILEASVEPLLKEIDWLRAQAWIEVAHRTQNRLIAYRLKGQVPPKLLERDAERNWLNVAGYCGKYLTRYPITPLVVFERLRAIKEGIGKPQSGPDRAVADLRMLFDDVYRNTTLRITLGDGERLAGRKSKAKKLYQEAADDLAAFRQSKQLETLLNEIAGMQLSEDDRRLVRWMQLNLGADGGLGWYAHALAVRSSR